MDPRKRLELAQASTPSLRLAAAPTQTATITNVNAPVNGPTLSDAPVQVAAPQYLQNQGEDPSQAIGPVDTSYASGQGYTPGQSSSLIDKVRGFINNSSEGTFARGIARILPGGMNDFKANEQMSSQASDRATQIVALLKAGKISQAQAKQLIQAEVDTTNQAVATQKNLEGTLPTRTQLAVSAAGSALDALSGGALEGVSAAKNTAAIIGGGAALGGANAAASGGNAKDILTGAAVGGAVPAALTGASAIISRIVTKSGLPEEAIHAVVQSGDEKAIKAVADSAGVTPQAVKEASSNLTEVLKANGPEVMSRFPEQTQKAFLDTGIKDPYNLLVNALAKEDNKTTIRSMVQQLVPGTDTTTLNRITRKLTNAKTSGEVHDIIDAETAKASAPAQDLSTPTTPVETPQSTALPTDQPPVDSLPPTVNSKPVVPNETNVAQGVAPIAAKGLENAPADVQAAAQDITAKLKDATANYQQIAKTRSQAKAQRIAVGAKAYEQAGGGAAGLKAKLGALKGSYDSGELPPVDVSAATKQRLLDHIENDPNLREFEKLNTQVALAKVLGDVGGHLTPGEIKYLGKAFGPDFAESATQAVEATATKLSKIKDAAGQVAGLPRALLSTLDFSFGGRQGAALGARYPKEWAIANRDSIRYAVDKGFFKQSMDAIENDGAYTTIVDKMKIALPAIQKDLKNEGFASADLAEKIPVAGKAIQGSDRAYNGGLTKLRFSTAKKIIDSYGGTDAFLKFFDGNDKALKDLGEVINTFSGRGGKPGGFVSKYGKPLSSALFSPRLWASRLNMLNPQFYARLEPAARKIALQSAASFATTAGTILAIASAAGADVVWDPRSADFAKIKVGNTRYDILGGLQQNIRLFAQEITGTKIDSTTGKPSTLGPDRGFGKPSRKDILYQAFENKENPLVAFATHMLEGTDPAGNPYNPLKEAGKLVVPLNVQSVASSTGDQGSVLKGALQNVPGVFGVGVQTYGPAKKDQPTATTQSIQAGKDAQKTKVDEFTNSLSKDQQALIKESDASLKQMVKDGKIDQATANTINGLKKAKDNLGGVTTPDGLKSTDAIDFYKKYNSLTADGQKAYLNAAPDKAAKGIADYLNKNKPTGVPDFPASNKLTKLYADYEHDINTHPDYTVIDKNNKAKAFFASATKQTYTQDAQDAYNEGSSNDLKQLIADGQVSKDTLDKAVALDNALYASGISGTLKFSKTFRKAGGYDVPTAPGEVSSGSGSSSTTKEKIVNQHLANLLPSAGKTAIQRPKISTSAKVTIAKPNLPSGGQKSSIKIKL